MELRATVDKAWLLQRMRENREKHHQVFLDALEGYRKHALEVLEAHVRDLREGRAPEIRLSVARPVDHTRDYDRVIEMLDADKGSEFTLDEQTFGQYVRDEWHWKQQWLKMSNRYAAASTQAAYGVVDNDDDEY